MQETLKEIARLKLENCKKNKEKERYEIILKILQNPNCFKKMKTENAYKLLQDLDFEENEIKKIYNSLIFSNLK